jgi:hypothetical protein
VTERTLGMRWLAGGADVIVRPVVQTSKVNTRTSLWADRWPAIAKQSCIDLVEVAPPDQQSQVKYDLPCHDCELSSQCLNAKNKEVGSLLYSREFLTAPRSAESSLFPRELMEPMMRPDLALQKTFYKHPDQDRELMVVQAWDLAWSERTGGDYLVCITALVNVRTGQRRLLYIERWQRLSFDDQCLLIEAKWRQYRADVVVIESDGAQSIWAQHIAARSPVPVVPHDAGGKRDLAHGVPSLLIQFQNRKWEIPFSPGSYLHEEVETLLSELEAFGWVDGKLEGVGEHDDTVMALWHLKWGIDTMVVGPVPLETHVGVQQGRFS